VLGLFHAIPVFGRLIHDVSTISFDCVLGVAIAAPLFDLVVFTTSGVSPYSLIVHPHPRERVSVECLQ
jgi:hypothetical protein